MRLRVNSPAVAHEVIEGEVVIIHFDTGNYYGLQGSAVEMWTALAQGASLAEAVLELEKLFEVEPEEIRGALMGFANEVVTENLMVPSTEGGNAMERAMTVGPRRPFISPRVEKYSDMQELLLLDPIHDVDEAGWPRDKA